MEFAQNTKAKILHASTSEIYGDPLEHPQNENYFGNVIPIGLRSCYDEGKRMAETLISKFSLESVENLECKLMSGGQVRKTAIAMSLMSKPEIILLDEPFSALDPKSVEDLQNTIANLQLEDSRRAFIITDHAYRELIQISDKLGLLADKHFVKQGPVREVKEDEVSRKVYFSSSFTNK